jgi:hypothetical protein
VIHAIVLGFGIGIGVFLWHFVVGLYDHCRERRAYRRGQQMLHPRLRT